MPSGRPLTKREIKFLDQLPRNIVVMRWMGPIGVVAILWAAFNHFRWAMRAGSQCGLTGFAEVLRFYFMENPAKRMYSLAELEVVGQTGAWVMFMMVAFVLALLVGSWLRQAKLLLKIRVSSNPEI